MRELSVYVFDRLVVTLYPIVIAVVFVSIGGCFKKEVLSPAGKEVRLLVKAEPDATCKELADISSGNTWFKNEADVKIWIRNQAAEDGGNVATLDVLKYDGSLVGASGRAFQCP